MYELPRGTLRCLETPSSVVVWQLFLLKEAPKTAQTGNVGSRAEVDAKRLLLSGQLLRRTEVSR